MIGAAGAVGDIQWAELVDVGTNIGLTLGALIVIARLLSWLSFRMLDTSMKRTTSLEDRVEKLEKRLRAEQTEHADCRQELSRHKIESAAAMAKLDLKIAALEAHIAAANPLMGDGWNNGPTAG